MLLRLGMPQNFLVYMDDKKKVLLVVTQGGPWGGAQRYVFDIAKSLKDVFQIRAAVGEKHGDQSLQEKLRKEGIEVTQLNHLVRSISPFKDTRAISELSDLYRDFLPDVVHLNSSKAGVLGALARRKKMKVVYTAHGWVFNEPLSFYKRSIYYMLEKVSARYKDAIVTLSEYDRKEGERVARKDALHVIPLGIELSDSFQKKLDFDLEDKFVFGTIANFYKTKGVDLLIDAFAKVRKKHKNISCVIIGDGDQRRFLEKKIDAHGLQDDVYLLGYMDNARQYLGNFDVFVLASRKEGLPYTILEAQAAGLPVIATNVGGVSSVVDSSTGWCPPPHDQSALAATMTASISRSDLQKLGDTAKARIKRNHTLSSMIEAIRELYAS